MLQARYIGRTHPYEFDGLFGYPWYFVHNKIYNIDVRENDNGYNWVIYVYNRRGKELAWVPYDTNPIGVYWIINADIDYILLGKAKSILSENRRSLALPA